jgi:hypothetical protein
MRPVVLMAALALGGCASVTGPVSYPAAWPAAEVAATIDGCPRLEGTYADAGSGSHPAESGAPPALSEVFSRLGNPRGPMRAIMNWQGWPALAPAESVQIRQGPDALVVTFAGGNGERTSLSFRRHRFNWSEERYDDLFTCYAEPNGARLRFIAEPEGYAENVPWIYVGAGGSLVFLLKAADGSLVVQWRSESLVVPSILVGAHMRFDSLWWRYPPLDSAMLRK